MAVLLPLRDWHELLVYNRHDVLALRHIMLKAAGQLESWRANARNRFCVDDGPQRICFMAGSQNPKLDALLKRPSADHWEFVTASNPASAKRRLPKMQRARRS